MKKLLIVCVLMLASCALFHTAAKPAAYGSELAACEAQSKSWDEYEPCCIGVARNYGRDPSFCMRPSDGGDQ
jgi:hypothetical protein